MINLTQKMKPLQGKWCLQDVDDIVHTKKSDNDAYVLIQLKNKFELKTVTILNHKTTSNKNYVSSERYFRGVCWDGHCIFMGNF